MPLLAESNTNEESTNKSPVPRLRLPVSWNRSSSGGLNHTAGRDGPGRWQVHGDDTTVPVLAKVKTRTGRIWTYVRDDRPFGGEAPPAAVFFYSPDRASIHPEQHLAGYSGILQADAYVGFNALYKADRKPGPITEAGCWAHARRKLFELADIASKARDQKPTTISPIAFEAVQKFDAIFMLERSINGLSPEQRVAARRKDIAPLVNDLIEWMKRERAKLSRHNEVAKAMDYMLKRIDVFTRFLEDGRICLSNNAAERELRGIALGRKSWLFAGSDRGGERAAVMLTLIQTAKLNDIDPQAWLADVLARIADHKITESGRTTTVELAPRDACRPRRLIWRRRLPQSPSVAPPKSSARTRNSCGTWLTRWSRRTAASGSMAPATSRPSPSRPPGWNICGSCSRSTNAIGHPRGLERMVTHQMTNRYLLDRLARSTRDLLNVLDTIAWSHPGLAIAGSGEGAAR